ncbi:CDP-glucose 4,6-dehydratase [Desulfosporosinus sp. FKA]|uniref:CDP-glucose 4,6-dehydratase n=1 Tax=Desulfosporosinus sp. FKA TaxID=1969834 RepID=UPI001A9A4A98|nr:CDP-glucose 4,6-dehydratase [Desulfosporosinus sp. FKA]
MEGLGLMLDFYKYKSVLITGHTGFKGAWLCEVLRSFGASITGYALPCVSNGIYDVLNIDGKITSIIGDIRNYDTLKAAFHHAKPEIVFHLAAQPLVLDAFERPAYTFETNVQGTVNLLECVRNSNSVKSVVVITTDKVYRNNEWVYGYRENDALGDIEPYAASKACVEIVAASYANTFLKDIAVSTTRAGNVIGGGDVSAHRIIPDCVRAARNNEPITVRNKYSVRPYQHVLEPLFAYLLIARKQYEDKALAGQYNIGPNESDCVTTAEIADVFCKTWGECEWQDKSNPNAPHESGLLKLDCSKMRSVFGWKPLWNIKSALDKVVEWETHANKQAVTEKQIKEYGSQLLNITKA